MEIVANRRRQVATALKEIGLQVASVLGGLLYVYVFFYWILYRGGGYLIHRLAVPTANDKDSVDTLVQIVKLLGGLVGAAVTVIIGAFVRQYVAFKSLREKIKLIEIFKQHVLEAASGPNDGATLSRIALDGDAVRFVLNDKDYGNLAKYLEPALVLDVLRTVAAIDEVASVVKEATSAKTATAIPKYALSQLERFNQQEILRQLVQPFLLGRASSDSAVDSQVQKLGSDE